ncbi:MAG: VWA domain-containing protein [Bacteroidetes bacterium]|nr:VWA domain-containing protein [Bacteroidota bacterium]MCB0844434.1 VWA domain-containing protein [Bacteroidota bacterium]
MIKFEHSEALYLLFLLIPLAILFLWFMLNRKRAISKLGESSLIVRLMPEKPTFKHQIKFALSVLAFIFMVIALANPQYSRTYEKVKRNGVDLMIALDISRSMLAEDTKPNRLAKSRQFISRLIDKLAGDRVGLIIFAGNAYLQVPITSDYLAMKTFLQTVNTELAPTQGTAIGEAIRMADKSFQSGQRQFKAMLVISDGENHEDDAIQAAKEATENGMIIHTMGVGSSKGAPIPEYNNQNIQVDYKRDKEGSIVFSKMNEQMLQEVATAGNGKYFQLNQGTAEVNAVINELENMEQQEFEEHVFTDYEDQYQWFLAIALFFLLLEYFITESRSRIFSDWSIFKT